MYIDGPWAVPTYQALNPVAELRHRAVAGRPRRVPHPAGGEDVVVAKGGHHLTDAELFAQFLDPPFAQLADGQDRRDVGIRD